MLQQLITLNLSSASINAVLFVLPVVIDRFIIIPLHSLMPTVNQTLVSVCRLHLSSQANVHFCFLLNFAAIQSQTYPPPLPGVQTSTTWCAEDCDRYQYSGDEVSVN